MNKIFKISLLAVIITALIPSAVMAKWWNPMTWSKDEPVVLQQVVETSAVHDQASLIKTMVEEVMASSTEVILSLRAEVTKLQSENDSLRGTVASLRSQLLAAKSVKGAEETKKDPVTVISPSVVKRPGAEIISWKKNSFRYDGYAAYVATIRVYAGDNGMNVPMTTNDQSTLVYGISYDTTNNFTGKRSSRVECTSVKKVAGENYCFVAPNSTLDIEVTVWLTPKESGNYSVVFKKLDYVTDRDNRAYLADAIDIIGETKMEEAYIEVN